MLRLRPAATLLRRTIRLGTGAARWSASQPAAGGGISPLQAVGGMAAAAVIGVGVGLYLPTGGAPAAPSTSAEPPAADSEPKEARRRSSVYEDVEDIADEIERPAMIRDASRSEVEALYEFQSLMASGGSAAVWRAVERATGRAVAIKVIDKKLLLPSLLNMEVYAMQRCSGHPNIAALLAAFDLPPDEASPDGEWHLVMELAEGGELFERLLQHGAYTEKVASDLLKQIASAVYHLHSCGVTHRDIKPENIVLMSDDEAAPVKLIDFGAALVLEEGEQVIRGGKVGTWTYWAPELADEDVPYDQAVDMWGLGVVLYIMLSGRHPFEKARASADDVLQGILDANYSFDSDAWNGVSGRAKELVARMLEKDPEKRMTAAELLSHSWVRGERVPERPLPDTQERLRAFKKATTAIHASLLLAVLLHQDSVLDAERSVGDSSGADGGKRVAGDDQGSRLRRSISISEGVGLRGGSGSSEDFNPLRAAYRLFDPTAKGHISAGDLQRVCSELGVEVSERDVENMLSVLAPSATTGAFSSSKATKQERMISYDKFSTMLQSSFQRTFDAGTAIFEQGDEVRGFYIIQKGECVVQARAAPDAPLREVTRLGAGDFFGETGLLEGRGRRNTTVTCATPVEVLMIDSPMFMELQSSGKGVAQRMRDRLGRRQRTRLRRAIELSQPDGRRALQRVQYKAGETVFAQGDAASHFYIVSNGTLAAEFTASTGERARLRTLGAGDQIGHDAMLGECHDTTVRCVTDATLLAVPRDSLQHALTTDSYLQSVWQAPAVDAIELRRQASQTLHSPAQIGRKGAAAAAVSKLAGSVAAGADSGTDTRLPADEFAMLMHRARPIRLENGECAIEQGSTPEAVFLLESGQVDVEYTSSEGETRVVNSLAAGEHFGESAILDGRDRRKSAVRCVANDGCALGVIGKASFLATVATQPQLADHFRQASAARTRSRLRTVVRMAAERSSDVVERKLQPGDVVFRQGEEGKHFFLVDAGKVQMSYTAEDGRLLPTRVHARGAVFGASGLLDGAEGADGAPRRNTAVALEETTLKVVPHASFKKLMVANPLIQEGLRRASNSVGLHALSRKSTRDHGGR